MNNIFIVVYIALRQSKFSSANGNAISLDKSKLEDNNVTDI